MTTQPTTPAALMKCDRCGSTKNVSREPSPSMLIFGPIRTSTGYLSTFENRCGECERQLTKDLLGGVSKTEAADG